MTEKEIKTQINNSLNIAVNKSNLFLKKLGLSLSLNFNYDFSYYDGNVVGVYEHDSVFSGDISIACNMNELYKYCKQEINSYPYSDPYTIIDEAAQTNVYHEMGHGIIELFNDYLENTDDLDNLYDQNKDLFDEALDNEEDAVEEFAWNFYDDCLLDSKLGQLIELYQKQLLNENWKGALLGLGLGAASLFGGANNAQAQTQTPNDTIGYEVVNQNGDTTRYMRDDYQDPEEWEQANKYFQKQLQKQTYNQQELMKLCPQAYKDMNKGPEIWKQNQNKYVYKNNNGQIVVVGKIAASHGQNPWKAILQNAGTKTTPIIKENIVKNKIIKNKYRNMKKQAIKLNETQLRNIIKENIKKVLNEDYSRAFELIEELKNCGLSSDDILRGLIARIGGYAAVKYLLDIKKVEIDPYCDDEEDMGD